MAIQRMIRGFRSLTIPLSFKGISILAKVCIYLFLGLIAYVLLFGGEARYIIETGFSDDTANKEPLFYEQYPGSIVDISQLQFMLEKAKGYGYKRAGFILDRGYFGKENIQYMDQCGYDFVIMIKGMGAFVKELILAKRGSFENIREYSIRKYKVSGTTVKKRL